MDNKNQFFKEVNKLLCNEKFIQWRLFQLIELDEYWSDFRVKNPHLENVFQEALIQFNEVKINHYPISDNDKKRVYKIIHTYIKKHKKHKRIIRLRYATGSAAVLLIGIFSLFYLIESRRDTSEVIIPQKLERIVGQTLPEEDIYLISSNGKIKLPDKSHIELISDGKAIVTHSSQSTKELLLSTTDFSRLVVPYGKRTDLTLSDGTKVWLNSGTQLDFPSKFNDKYREIFVNGEIYIDVAKDMKIPFIVHAENLEVNVTGTAFNISAYIDDTTKTVVLVNGIVNIETDNNYNTELLPNEKIEITDFSITKDVVDVSQYISWKDGVLEFNSTPMSEILKRVGRYYNVQFEKTDEVALSDKTFSGKLFLSNNLDSVMTSISAISSTDYLRNENKLILSKKEMPMRKLINLD